jgi:biopolymer transport protein ExbB
MIISQSYSLSKKQLEAQQKELEVLKGFLQQARDSLQYEITQRWRYKQRTVEQRELDKEAISSLKDKQERAYNELSQVKEECFAVERQIEDERKTVATKKDEWEYVVSSFEEIFEKEAETLIETMPLGLEKRREQVEALRREYRKERRPYLILPEVTGYYIDQLERGGTITLSKRVVMPDEGEPQEMTVIRFGNVFGYGLNNAGEPYSIRQTGKLGAARYTIEPIGMQAMKEFFQQKIPQWDREKTITGGVVVDVMQNANSSLLISGKKIKTTTRIRNWLQSGGPVMVPLIALLLWALILVILKIWHYSKKHKSNRDLYDTVASMLRKNEKEKAFEYAKKHKGVVARVVTTCLEHSKWNRTAAEKGVREILIEEGPQLNKHLATLAVIAGAAPLLGLLGTVTGMINLFEVITHYGTGDPKILAGGISEALITTQTGLAVAIPILLIHNYLRNKSNHIQSEMEKNAIRILNRLWPEAA